MGEEGSRELPKLG